MADNQNNTPGPPTNNVDGLTHIAESLQAVTDAILGMMAPEQPGAASATTNANAGSSANVQEGMQRNLTQQIAALSSGISALNNNFSALANPMNTLATNTRRGGGAASAAGGASTGGTSGGDVSANSMSAALEDGMTRALRTKSGQAAYEYMSEINSGRQPSVMPFTLASTYAHAPGMSVLPGQAPLSVSDRLNRTRSIQAGLTIDNINPTQFGAAAQQVQYGAMLRQSLSPDQQRVVRGSLKRSMEFVREKGAAGDEVRNVTSARSAWRNVAEQTGMSEADFQAGDVGMVQRAMRSHSDLSGTATSSLNRLAQGYQTAGTSYRSVISMDAPGGMITKNTVNPDTIGHYIQDTAQELQQADTQLLHRDTKGTAVQDLGRKVTSINDTIASAFELDSVQRGIEQSLGRERAPGVFQDIQGMKDARNKSAEARKKAAEQDGKRAMAQAVAEQFPVGSPERQAADKKVQQAQRRYQSYSRTAESQNVLYQERLQSTQNAFSSRDVRGMERSSNSELQRLAEMIRTKDSLSRRRDVIAGDAPMSMGERAGQAAGKASAMGGQMAAMNMQNLQWALMFAFSGTVFQALSQMPSEASYKAVTPVYQGVGNITGLTPLFSELSSFPQQAGSIMSDLQTRTNTMTSLLGTSQGARQAVGKALDISKEQPVQFGEAMEIMTAMATYPSTRASAKNPEFQTQMFETVQLLSMLAPEQGTGGALFAIREMLGGQFRSLQMRFNISPELLAGYAGTTTSELKGGTGTELIGSMHMALTNLFGGPEILMRRGAQMDVQLANVSDVMTAAVIKPLVMDRQPGIVRTLNGIMDEGGPGVKENSILGGLERIIAPQQVRAIEAASLDKTASEFNLKKEQGDTLNTLAQKLDPDKREAFKERYRETTRETARDLYSTGTGAVSLVTTGVATALDSVMGSFDLGSTFGGIYETSIGQISGRLTDYNKSMSELDSGEVTGGEGRRKKIAVDLIDGILTDIQNQISSVSGAMSSNSELKRIISRVADTARVGAEAMFAPVARVIMAQTAKTAIQLPGMLIGGAMEMGVGATHNAVKGVFTGNVTGEGLADAASNVSNMASWGSLMLAQSSPWKAAQLFAGASAAGRGFGQLQDSPGAGLGNLALSAGIMTMPSIVQGVFKRGREAQTREYNRPAPDRTSTMGQLRERSGSLRSLGGLTTFATLGGGMLFDRALGAIGGGGVLGEARKQREKLTDIRNRRTDIVNPMMDDRTGVRSETNRREKLTQLDAEESRVRSRTKQIFRPIRGAARGIGAAGAIGGIALGAYQASQASSPRQAAGGLLTGLGGILASTGLYTAMTGAGVVPGAIMGGIGAAAMAAGTILSSDPTEDARVQEQIERVQTAREEVVADTFTRPRSDRLSRGDREWNMLVENYKLDEKIDPETLETVRQRGRARINTTEDSRLDLFNSTVSAIMPNVKLTEAEEEGKDDDRKKLALDNKKLGIEGKLAKMNTEQLSTLFESPEAFFTKKNGKIVGEGGQETLQSDFKDSLKSMFKKAVGDIENVDELSEAFVTMAEKNARLAAGVIRQSKADFNDFVAPEVRAKARDEMYWGEIKTEGISDRVKDFNTDKEYKQAYQDFLGKENKLITTTYDNMIPLAKTVALAGGDPMGIIRTMERGATENLTSKLFTGDLSPEQLQNNKLMHQFHVGRENNKQYLMEKFGYTDEKEFDRDVNNKIIEGGQGVANKYAEYHAINIKEREAMQGYEGPTKEAQGVLKRLHSGTLTEEDKEDGYLGSRIAKAAQTQTDESAKELGFDSKEDLIETTEKKVSAHLEGQASESKQGKRVMSAVEQFDNASKALSEDPNKSPTENLTTAMTALKASVDALREAVSKCCAGKASGAGAGAGGGNAEVESGTGAVADEDKKEEAKKEAAGKAKTKEAASKEEETKEAVKEATKEEETKEAAKKAAKKTAKSVPEEIPEEIPKGTPKEGDSKKKGKGARVVLEYFEDAPEKEFTGSDTPQKRKEGVAEGEQQQTDGGTGSAGKEDAGKGTPQQTGEETQKEAEATAKEAAKKASDKEESTKGKSKEGTGIVGTGTMTRGAGIVGTADGEAKKKQDAEDAKRAEEEKKKKEEQKAAEAQQAEKTDDAFDALGSREAISKMVSEGMSKPQIRSKIRKDYYKKIYGTNKPRLDPRDNFKGRGDQFKEAMGNVDSMYDEEKALDEAQKEMDRNSGDHKNMKIREPDEFDAIGSKKTVSEMARAGVSKTEARSKIRKDYYKKIYGTDKPRLDPRDNFKGRGVQFDEAMKNVDAVYEEQAALDEAKKEMRRNAGPPQNPDQQKQAFDDKRFDEAQDPKHVDPTTPQLKEAMDKAFADKKAEQAKPKQTKPKRDKVFGLGARIDQRGAKSLYGATKTGDREYTTDGGMTIAFGDDTRTPEERLTEGMKKSTDGVFRKGGLEVRTGADSEDARTPMERLTEGMKRATDIPKEEENKIRQSAISKWKGMHRKAYGTDAPEEGGGAHANVPSFKQIGDAAVAQRKEQLAGGSEGTQSNIFRKNGLSIDTTPGGRKLTLPKQGDVGMTSYDTVRQAAIADHKKEYKAAYGTEAPEAGGDAYGSTVPSFETVGETAVSKYKAAFKKKYKRPAPEEGSYLMQSGGRIHRAQYKVPKPVKKEDQTDEEHEKALATWKEGETEFFEKMGGNEAFAGAQQYLKSTRGAKVPNIPETTPDLNVGRLIPPEIEGIGSIGPEMLRSPNLGVPNFQKGFQENFMNIATKSADGKSSKDFLSGANIVIQNTGGAKIFNQ